MTPEREAETEVCLVSGLELRVHLSGPESRVDVLEKDDGVFGRVCQPVQQFNILQKKRQKVWPKNDSMRILVTDKSA